METAFCVTPLRVYEIFMMRRLQVDESVEAYVADLTSLARLSGD